jgi:hypothetical protein
MPGDASLAKLLRDYADRWEIEMVGRSAHHGGTVVFQDA